MITTVEQFEARYAQQCALQEEINRLALSATLTLERVVEIAEEANSEYSQYNRYFRSSGWRLVTFSCSIETKLGVAFEPGDVTLGRRHSFSSSLECWSIRNKCLTIVDVSYGACWNFQDNPGHKRAE